MGPVLGTLEMHSLLLYINYTVKKALKISLILQKQKVCYLLLGKNISFARFILILVLKTVILNKFMSTGTLALLLMMNLAGDHTLLAHVKQFKKSLSVVTTQTLCGHS